MSLFLNSNFDGWSGGEKRTLLDNIAVGHMFARTTPISTLLLEKNVSKLNAVESEINATESEINPVKKRAKSLPKPKQPKIQPNTSETEISLQETLPKTTKKKKQSIPKNVKVLVWSNYIGENINSHRCLCCKKSIINITNFDVGHVISEKEGGTLEISNLRPICSACNSSMGSMNMIEYVKKYGLYIG